MISKNVVNVKFIHIVLFITYQVICSFLPNNKLFTKMHDGITQQKMCPDPANMEMKASPRPLLYEIKHKMILLSIIFTEANWMVP